ncbi:MULTISPECIES: alpha/beta fold hydrolase [Mycolicibacterium]|jgi:3-oxoadipate enol-lactonase|uniref:Hydrolase or acyltransferase of alpha/beta superfamily protein n=2 Tax=Mycolicibacterium TaxID=1866885 RepID=W9AQU4_MYCCO|nr:MULTISPECIES: alpha/beta hydrolase [Mycolicibacterium]OKH75164.1 alpha/beta hydrolase [Mycobacterium sp. SWH-M5]MBU8826990.1 alpha/beta hydrolase [Mycolicibacterium goodii]MBU8840486.1 alpha/beta hydrolase [Mycolicibacterium goodii]TLH71787.1 alpha/beta hydrolase [Mycolicibacterium cosmeticum]CDO08119.1 hydrolase or acyltransferase of alpha/beta superfamily protein [Mycolicibacterium cosmeticum]
MVMHTLHVGDDGWPLMGEVVGRGELIIMLHGGGPDHHSMRPLADRLAGRYRVALPDIRGYGASRCPDPTLHRWNQYVTDTIAIMHALDATSTHLVGAGLGGTIALRTCLQHPQIARSAVVISAEAIEDDQDKTKDTKLMDRFAERARSRGLQAAWELFVPHLQPLIANLVTEAIPRADAQSAAAAAAIGHDRAFAAVEELRRIDTPTLIIAGDDPRHPTQLARTLADTLPHGVLAESTMSDRLVAADDLAHAFGPEIEQFLATTLDPDA